MTRSCPYCGYIDQTQPGDHILAVFNGREGKALIGGCSCPVCNQTWTERAYPERLVNILADGSEVEARL